MKTKTISYDIIYNVHFLCSCLVQEHNEKSWPETAINKNSFESRYYQVPVIFNYSASVRFWPEIMLQEQLLQEQLLQEQLLPEHE